MNIDELMSTDKLVQNRLLGQMHSETITDFSIRFSQWNNNKGKISKKRRNK